MSGASGLPCVTRRRAPRMNRRSAIGTIHHFLWFRRNAQYSATTPSRSLRFREAMAVKSGSSGGGLPALVRPPSNHRHAEAIIAGRQRCMRDGAVHCHHTIGAEADALDLALPVLLVVQ